MQQLQKFKSLQLCTQILWWKFCWRELITICLIIFLSYFLDAQLIRFLSLAFASVIWNVIKFWYNCIEFFVFHWISPQRLQKLKSSRLFIQTLRWNFCCKALIIFYLMVFLSNFLDARFKRFLFIESFICNLQYHQILIQLHQIDNFSLNFHAVTFKN